MLFQVSKDGRIMFQTEYQECVPSDDEIKAMKKSGYMVKMKEHKNNEKSRE